LVDCIHNDAVFTAFEYLLALKFDCGFGTIGPVDEATVRMDVDRAGRLTRPNVVRSASASARCAISGLILPFSIRYMYNLFCVSIDTYIQGLVG